MQFSHRLAVCVPHFTHVLPAAAAMSNRFL